MALRGAFTHFFCDAQPKLGFSGLTFEVSRSNTVGSTLVAETTIYTSYNKHKRQTFMNSSGFEPASQAMEHLH